MSIPLGPVNGNFKKKKEKWFQAGTRNIYPLNPYGHMLYRPIDAIGIFQKRRHPGFVQIKHRERTAWALMSEIISGRCRRCGTCCKKGGPSFHLEDRHLIDQGVIPCSRIYTIRRGEPAHDNIEGGVLPVENDLIKIKGIGNAWTCIFYDDALKGCGIYDNRPLECRVLKCWDTAEIEALYRKNRLTRKDLLGHVQGLWDLIADHQIRCSYDDIRELLVGVKKREIVSIEKLREMVLYDLNLRHLVTEKGPVTTEMTDFLLGRPLVETLKPMGVSLLNREGRLTL